MTWQNSLTLEEETGKTIHTTKKTQISFAKSVTTTRWDHYLLTRSS